MKKTHVDILLELPVDGVLRSFLTSHGLPVPDDFDWNQADATSKALVDAVHEWPDAAARDQMIGNLMASVQLGDATGKQALFEAAMWDSAALTGLTLCGSDLHRSFWLYANHPDIFERALDFNFWEHHGPQTQQYDLGITSEPDSSTGALDALRGAISDFYQQELRCGDSSMVHLVERSPGVFPLTVHVKDLATLRLEFEGTTLKRRVGNPNIHMALKYSRSTSVVRTLVRGGAKYQQMLVDAFAQHVLGIKVNAQRIKSPTLDLSSLRTGFDVPEVFEDGFAVVQLKTLTLLSPDSQLKLECVAMASKEQRSVHELLQEKLPTPLADRWTVTAAQINLYYPPEPGRRAKVVCVEVTSKGRLNLHQFDARLQTQLESYLVKVGILQKGQMLNAQETPPGADAVGSSPESVQ